MPPGKSLTENLLTCHSRFYSFLSPRDKNDTPFGVTPIREEPCIAEKSGRYNRNSYGRCRNGTLRELIKNQRLG